MKVRFEQPVNVNGKNYRKGDEGQLSVEDAKALARAGFVTIIKERAVVVPQMETRE